MENETFCMKICRTTISRKAAIIAMLPLGASALKSMHTPVTASRYSTARGMAASALAGTSPAITAHIANVRA